MNMIEEVRRLSDDDLEKELKFLAAREKNLLPNLLAHLAEFDSRQICAKKRYSDLFSYCVTVLGYEEGDAYRRIRAARVIRRWGEAHILLSRGKLSLSALVSLSPVLTNENREELFRKCEGKTRREIEAMVASIQGVDSRPDWMRRRVVAGGWTAGPAAPPDAKEALPIAPAEVGTPPVSAPLDATSVLAPEIPSASRRWEWQATVPISLERVRIGFDAGVALMNLLNRARQVLRHKYPDGRYEDIVSDALELLLDRKDPQRKFALKPTAQTHPSVEADVAVTPASPGLFADAPSGEPRFLGSLKAGRYIPAKVKSAVWQRDGGRCAWRYDDGTVCGSRDLLEFDHVVPFAKGGRSDLPRNLRLLCRTHNQAAAVSAFGADACRSRSSRGAGGSA